MYIYSGDKPLETTSALKNCSSQSKLPVAIQSGSKLSCKYIYTYIYIYAYIYIYIWIVNLDYQISTHEYIYLIIYISLNYL
jgi:hypothetical protein